MKGGSVLAIGYNKRRNDSAFIDIAPLECSFHAEEVVLKQAKRVRGATIYVARVNRLGEWRLAKPCGRCQLALDEAGITKVFHT